MSREVRTLPRGEMSLPIVLLGDVGKWSMVRHAEYPTACPFVISRKDWDKCPIKVEE